MKRRTALKLLGASAATLCFDRLGYARTPAADFSPIDRSLGEIAPAQFAGDEPARPHRLLRDAPGPFGLAMPAPERRVPLVVVGGGIGGLTTAYLLRAHRPVLLEQAARFGGNSKGASWRGIEYALGAAYFVAPEEGSALQGLYRELGVDRMWSKKPAEHPVALRGRWHDDLWRGLPEGAARRQAARLERHLRDVLAGRRGLVYPEIPAASPQQRRRVDALDRRTFRRHLESVLGAPLRPQLATALEHYCYSSFGASAAELSAAAGLNFLAAEFGGICVTPGGNAAVAERLLDRLAEALPPEHLRAGACVYRVRTAADGVEVAYEEADGRLRCLHAKAVVLACPKFVAAKLLEGIEPQRLEAIGRLRYRSYLVANVLLRRRPARSFYDLYLLGAGDAGRPRAATDVVLGSYAQPQQSAAVLTLYRAMPYEGARTELEAEGAYARYRSEFARQVGDEVLPLLGLGTQDVRDLRIARWGHPLPVAAPGLIAGGVTDRLRAPFRERVFFVQQDNWALPALETAATEALLWAPEVERALSTA